MSSTAGPSRALAELAHALEAFADALRLDRAQPDDEQALRDLSGQARVLSIRPHPAAAADALLDRVPHLVEADHRATHSRYGHLQLRIDRAVAALRPT